MKKFLFLLSVCGLLFANSFPVYGAERLCPGPNKGTINSQFYRFTYESWIVDAPNEYMNKRFGRCVEPTTRQSVYIDWNKATLEGYASNGAPLESTLPTRDGQPSILDTVLGYGEKPANLTTVQVPLIVPRFYVDSKPIPDSKPSPEGLESEDISPEYQREFEEFLRRNGKLKSTIRFAIPIDQKTAAAFNVKVSSSLDKFGEVFLWETEYKGPIWLANKMHLTIRPLQDVDRDKFLEENYFVSRFEFDIADSKRVFRRAAVNNPIEQLTGQVVFEALVNGKRVAMFPIQTFGHSAHAYMFLQ